MSCRRIILDPTPAEFVAEFGPTAIARAEESLAYSKADDVRYPPIEGKPCHTGDPNGANAKTIFWKQRHCRCFGPTETEKRAAYLDAVKAIAAT